jgi:hypothetical protein
MEVQQSDPDAAGTGIAGTEVMAVAAMPTRNAPVAAPTVATPVVADRQRARVHSWFSAVATAGAMAAAGGLAFVLLAGARSPSPPEHPAGLAATGTAAAPRTATEEHPRRPAGILSIPIEPDRLDDRAANPTADEVAAPRRAALVRAADTSSAVKPPTLNPEVLIARGDQFLANADVVSARLFYRLAARVGSARAALAMAETFDATALARHGVRGTRPDAAAAALSWYRSAAAIGDEPTAGESLAMSEQHPEGQAGDSR